MPGLFVAFEGIDGAGKTSQAHLTAIALRELGHTVTATREPGGTHLGKRVRSTLLDPNVSISAPAELLLYLADRAEHVTTIINPALIKGEIVICDRFSDSTVAYQGYARDLGPEWVADWCSQATGNLWPDLTVLLDLDPQLLSDRLSRQPDRLERSGIDFFLRARAGFLELARRSPERFLVLDASLNSGILHKEIIRAITDRLMAS